MSPNVLRAYCLIVPADLTYAERLSLIFAALKALARRDAWRQASFATYTCSLGITEGGAN
jgi:hypothetical protein